MTWRTIVVSKQSKLSYKCGYFVIRNEETRMIHLSEINTIIIDSTAVSMTSYLLSELMNNKIKLVFCDEKRNPQGELIPYYGSHNSSKRIFKQINWDKEILINIWTKIIYQKIINQSTLMRKNDMNQWTKLIVYANELQPNDITNREGHAAKVFFNSLFGKGFSRDEECDINSALNYGYSILLSNFNKEIISCGYLTQIGMKHKNEFNPFNLTSDLMEPFRPIVDELVYASINQKFDSDYKMKLIDLMNKKVKIDGKEQYLNNAIAIYVQSVFKAIDNNAPEDIKFFEFV